MDTWAELTAVWSALEAEAAAGGLLQEDRCIRVFERLFTRIGYLRESTFSSRLSRF